MSETGKANLANERRRKQAEDYLIRVNRILDVTGLGEDQDYAALSPGLLYMHDSYIKVDDTIYGPACSENRGEAEYVGERLKLESDTENEFKASR